MKVLVTQSCLTLCDPMDCSPPGSSVHGILQGRVLEWVAFPFSRGSSQPRGSNSGLSHRRQILYHLSHQGSARKRRTLMLFQVKHGWLRRRKKIKRSPKSPGRTGLRGTPWKIHRCDPCPHHPVHGVAVLPANPSYVFSSSCWVPQPTHSYHSFIPSTHCRHGAPSPSPDHNPLASALTRY